MISRKKFEQESNESQKRQNECSDEETFKTEVSSENISLGKIPSRLQETCLNFPDSSNLQQVNLANFRLPDPLYLISSRVVPESHFSLSSSFENDEKSSSNSNEINSSKDETRTFPSTNHSPDCHSRLEIKKRSLKSLLLPPETNENFNFFRRMKTNRIKETEFKENIKQTREFSIEKNAQEEGKLSDKDIFSSGSIEQSNKEKKENYCFVVLEEVIMPRSIVREKIEEYLDFGEETQKLRDELSEDDQKDENAISTKNNYEQNGTDNDSLSIKEKGKSTSFSSFSQLHSFSNSYSPRFQTSLTKRKSTKQIIQFPELLISPLLFFGSSNIDPCIVKFHELRKLFEFKEPQTACYPESSQKCSHTSNEENENAPISTINAERSTLSSGIPQQDNFCEIHSFWLHSIKIKKDLNLLRQPKHPISTFMSPSLNELEKFPHFFSSEFLNCLPLLHESEVKCLQEDKHGASAHFLITASQTYSNQAKPLLFFTPFNSFQHSKESSHSISNAQNSSSAQPSKLPLASNCASTSTDSSKLNPTDEHSNNIFSINSPFVQTLKQITFSKQMFITRFLSYLMNPHFIATHIANEIMNSGSSASNSRTETSNEAFAITSQLTLANATRFIYALPMSNAFTQLGKKPPSQLQHPPFRILEQEKQTIYLPRSMSLDDLSKFLLKEISKSFSTQKAHKFFVMTILILTSYGSVIQSLNTKL